MYVLIHFSSTLSIYTLSTYRNSSRRDGERNFTEKYDSESRFKMMNLSHQKDIINIET